MTVKVVQKKKRGRRNGGVTVNAVDLGSSGDHPEAGKGTRVVSTYKALRQKEPPRNKDGARTGKGENKRVGGRFLLRKEQVTSWKRNSRRSRSIPVKG